MTTELAELLDSSDAWALADAIRTGATTVEAVFDETAARLQIRNPAINAVIEDRLDEARAEIDAGLPDGPLRGVPFVVKALGAQIAGMTTTNGSALWRDDVALADSELVRRYRAAGLVLIGLTNSPELGKSASTEPTLHGPTRNPRRLTHSAGGSSGGSAAAVAAGIVVAAHGNDGGGSIRIPASMNGLVGLKPSRGRVPAAPALNAISYPIAVNHVICRSVRDAAWFLDLTAGSLPGDPFVIAPPSRPYVDELGSRVATLRIAVCTTMPTGENVHPACAAAVQRCALVLRELGHEVIDADPPWPLDDLRRVNRVVPGVATLTDIRARLAVLDRELRDDDLEPFTRVLVDAAAKFSGVDVIEALKALERAAQAFGPFFDDYDILLTPTLSQPVPPLGLLDTRDVAAMYANASRYSALTSPFNISGQPALSLPLAIDGDAMPIGLQFVARFGGEDVLIRLGSQLEAAQPWDSRPVWPPA